MADPRPVMAIAVEGESEDVVERLGIADHTGLAFIAEIALDLCGAGCPSSRHGPACRRKWRGPSRRSSVAQRTLSEKLIHSPSLSGLWHSRPKKVMPLVVSALAGI